MESFSYVSKSTELLTTGMAVFLDSVSFPAINSSGIKQGKRVYVDIDYIYCFTDPIEVENASEMLLIHVDKKLKRETPLRDANIPLVVGDNSIFQFYDTVHLEAKTDKYNEYHFKCTDLNCPQYSFTWPLPDNFFYIRVTNENGNTVSNTLGLHSYIKIKLSFVK